MSSCLNICVFVIFCTTVVSIISIVTPYWITENILVDNNRVHAYAGLWKTCTEAGGITDCEAYSDVKDWVDAVRYCMISATVLTGLSCLVALLVAIDTSERNAREKNYCKRGLFYSGISLIVAVSVFGKNIDDDKVSYDYSYYLAILAAVMAILSTLTFCIVSGQPNHTTTSQPNHTTASA